ncbi:MAG: hypothetical protein QF530_05340, partial [SAR202 cluster bacterium]|nr:hypothetical protein [SAR202 cluster bacterium]
MKLKFISLLLLLPVLMLLLAACGDSQIADTPTPEAKVVAKVKVEPSPTKEHPKPEPTKPSTPTEVPPTVIPTTVPPTPVPATPTATPTVPTATPTPTPRGFTYSLEKIPGSLNHSPDSTWWGYNQSKIARYGDTVFTYVVHNDNDSATESLMTLYK